NDGPWCWVSREVRSTQPTRSRRRLDQLERGLRYDGRHLLREIVAGARNDPALIGAGEELGMVGRARGRTDAVGLAMQVDGGRCNPRACGQTLLDRLERGVALGIAEAMAIRLDGDVDEIWIVERDS